MSSTMVSHLAPLDPDRSLLGQNHGAGCNRQRWQCYGPARLTEIYQVQSNSAGAVYVGLWRLCETAVDTGKEARTTMGAMTRVAEAAAIRGPASITTRDRAPIDRVHLARYTLGNLALDAEILGLFAMQAPQTLEQLRTARTAKAWYDAVHTLKGSARAVGANRVADLATLAEALGATPTDTARTAAIGSLTEALLEATLYIEGLEPWA